MKDIIMVSVIMTTYNHQKYIAQAIEGVMQQQVDFNFELIIGDDCSTDNTSEIIQNYINKYSDKIKGIRWKKNVGEQRNTCKLLQLARGRYIAVCEGDDFWIDSLKLKTQIDFLEKHNEYIGTAHNVLCVDAEGKRLKRKLVDFPYKKSYIYGKENALNYEELGQMSSYVYRNFWKDFGNENFNLFKRCKANTDTKLNATLGLLGKVYYMEKVMSHRRRLFSEDGWTAYAFNNNVLDYLYRNCVNIRDYIEKVFGESLNCDFLLMQYKNNALKKFLEKPCKKNFEILSRVYLLHGENENHILFDIVQNFFSFKILKKDNLEFKFVKDRARKYGYCNPVNVWTIQEKNCSYFQNPKVACSSIKESMFALPEVDDYEDIHDMLLGREEKLPWNELYRNDESFKFTFVRNPYERLVSCYVNKFITDKEHGKRNYFDDYFLKWVRKSKNFTDFVLRIIFIPDKYADVHFRSQVCITHTKKGKKRVDYIGKYENINSEYDKIRKRYGLNKLKWYNKSFKYDWKEYYNIFTALMVYIRYHRDFDLYGYKKELSHLLKFRILRMLYIQKKRNGEI